MNNIGTIIAMGVLVMMSAYFSATETAFNSLNITKLKISAEKGDKGAILILRLVEDYNRLLTTILVGNNIVNIALSAMATVSPVAFSCGSFRFNRNPMHAPSAATKTASAAITNVFPALCFPFGLLYFPVSFPFITISSFFIFSVMVNDKSI